MLCELKKMDKKELMENKNVRIGVIVFAVIAGLATVAAAAYGVYRFFIRDRYDDFEDDFDDLFEDDDVFEDEK